MAHGRLRARRMARAANLGIGFGAPLFAGLLINAVASMALAEAPAPSPAADTTASVIAYPASFFAPMGPNTAYDMVRRIPGFAIDDGSSLRGFAGSAGNVLIDGQRPASKTDDLISVLGRIPAAQVERIDLIRGAQPGIDMQGKTVVANVIHKKGQGITGVAAVGQYTTADGYTDPQVKLEGTWRADGRTLEGSLFAFKGHDNSQGGGRHVILGPGGQQLDVSQTHNTAPNSVREATAAYEAPVLGGKARLNLTLEDQPYDIDSVDVFQHAGRQEDHLQQDAKDAEGGLHYNRDFGSTLGLEVFGLQHLNRARSTSTFVTATDNQRFALATRGGESIGRGVLHWRPTAALTIDGGGEVAYNWLTTQTAFSDNGAAIPIPAGDVRVTETRGEAFTTATWRPVATLSMEAGVRVEGSTIASTGDVTLSKSLVFPKPRLLITWSPDAADQVRVRVEREVGQLDFTSFAASAALNINGVVAGNPNLLPQQDWAFEAAYDRHFWKTGVVSLTLRHLVLKDVVDRVPVFAPSGAFDEPGNIGGGSENDVVAAFELPLGRFGIGGGTLRGTGTWKVSEVTDPTTGQRRRISGQHPLDASLHFSQDLPRWNLNWGFDLPLAYREHFFRFNEIDTNRANTVGTLFLEYKPKPDLGLRFTLDTHRGVYDVGREVFAGPRNTAPLRLMDLQDRRFGPVFFARIRKTFG
ncbi:TonB-dependent receptor plug domain-containing protein [Phenylobacterium sp.]|uniref:TonB-dependent receptor plug domain-containing protein n=1 Tax=Phenylobacterium sp. TaxID=1871053 RepID=UPI002DE6045E|nr:TonB-dependent receptor [Phenylobacterium sp.]